MPLAEPFIVEVIDADYSPVEDVRVQFRVTQGSGRFSPRTLRTDAEGLAETTFTPISAGRVSVVATVAGVDASAEFTVSVEEAPEAADPVISSTRIEPRSTCRGGEPSTDVMGRRWRDLWTRGCETPKEFAPSVSITPLNIAVDASNGKVYWTEKTGGSRWHDQQCEPWTAQALRNLPRSLSVPMGISVDA